MARSLIDDNPVDHSTSWANDQAPCLQCGAQVATACEDQCPAAIATELTDEADVRFEAAYERGAA